MQILVVVPNLQFSAAEKNCLESHFNIREKVADLSFSANLKPEDKTSCIQI